MGGISTSVGLISGIDSGAIIEQLLAIDARPKLLAQNRVAQLQQRQAAFLSLNSSLSGLDGAISTFTVNDVFDSKSAASSKKEVLTATASSRAATGSYTFLVDRLVSTQSFLSRGFANRDVSSFGAKEFVFEGLEGSLVTETRLADLNGGEGIQRGRFDITDRDGNSVTIDLSRAVTLDEVVENINSKESLGVVASIEQGALVLTDTTGGSGNLIVSDRLGFTTATDLGIATSESGIAADTVNGGSRFTLSRNTSLKSLNDGLGIFIRDGNGNANAELRFKTADGQEFFVNLGEQTEVVVSEDYTFEDLIFREGDVYEEPDDPPEGFEPPPTETRVTRTRAATVGDLIDRVTEATGGDLNAGTPGAISVSIDEATGQFVFTDNTSGGSTFEALAGSAGNLAAQNLGIVGTDAGGVIRSNTLLARAGTVLVSSLNGGSGLTQDSIEIRDRAGNATLVELDPEDLQGDLDGLLARINSILEDDGVGVTFSINPTTRGITITDTTGSTATTLDISGGLAEELGIDSASNPADGSVVTVDSLQKAYVGRQTRLEDFNGGVSTGQIRITDASGGVSTIEIGSSIRTFDDLINRINSDPNIDVTASINEKGDGLSITDTSGVTGSNATLRIEDVSGRAARDLRIRGSFGDEDGVVKADGSLETIVKFDAADTLDDAISKINDAAGPARASVINDGASSTPFRITFTARDSGSAGRFLFESGDFDLGLREVNKGQDALAFLGSTDPASAVLLSSSTNTLDNVIQGVTIDLVSASDEPVTLTVNPNNSAIENAVQSFVDSYNSVFEQIENLTFFNADTGARGVLFGNGTVNNISNTLTRISLGRGQDLENNSYQFLFEVGVKVGEGGLLEFDRNAFREAYEDDPNAVKNLFSERQLLPREPIEISPGITTPQLDDQFGRLGIPAVMERFIDQLTNSIDGVLTGQEDSIQTQIDAQQARIERLDVTLERKRARYEQQFLNMELALARLQSQQGALTALSSGQTSSLG